MKKIKFLKPVLSFLFIALLITTLARLLLFLFFRERVVQTHDFWILFPIGLRMDLIVICYMLFLPTALIFLLPDNFLKNIIHFIHKKNQIFTVKELSRNKCCKFVSVKIVILLFGLTHKTLKIK